ncbi:permease [Bacillus sp. B1-b2]|uniref:permease n=1 Tax=Bacillus sp. B1-b2 TaxID=2653201 RepID=UPI001261F352|nr:permease [Bacillus sp. B1-b2]KAB7671303.1 permease [Bacillus sp. B1-b2]
MLLQMNTIFISIVIEALPFILIGVLISGIIQIFISEEFIARIMPKNMILAVIFSSLLGSIIPACECGIVPITRRLMLKGVPLPAAMAFMLTGPIINPIVLSSTYIAFGNSWKMVFYRAGLALVTSIIVGILLKFFVKESPLKNSTLEHIHYHSFKEKIDGMLKHSIDEFFSVGKFLIIGSLIAAAVQTFISTATLVQIGSGPFSSHLVMMGLAYILSLCSQADAFVASSFRNSFSEGAILSFLIFGPMLDIKNTFMLLSTFKANFVWKLTAIITITVLIVTILV